MIIADPTQGHSTSYRTLEPAVAGNSRTANWHRRTERQQSSHQLWFIPPFWQKSHAAFMRGDHDIAVFAAFKAIEVAVRSA